MESARGVLWDLDGVLIDTGPFHLQAWSQVLPEYDLSFTDELFRSTFGMNNTGVLTALMGKTPSPDVLSEVSNRKESLFRQLIHGRARPLPGVFDWLQRLARAGVRQAVASSAPWANIEALVDEMGMRPYFEAMISGSDLPPKPAPAVFLHAADRIGVPPRRCIVVEDAVTGVKAARRAGMKCIAVTTTHPADELTSANVVIERLDMLPTDAFDRLFGERGR